MNPEWNEERIRDWFFTVRRQEGGAAPPFATVWQAAVGRRRKQQAQQYLLGMLALTLLIGWCLTGGAGRPTAGRGVRRTLAADLTAGLPWQSAVLICEWRSPTAFLLEVPGEPGSRVVNPGESRPTTFE